MLVKALACELPATRGLPLSRVSCSDIAREVQRSGVAATLSDTTVWRWLSEDAIRLWQHRCWIFPCDPQFAAKAGRVLDLYARRWKVLSGERVVESYKGLAVVERAFRCLKTVDLRPPRLPPSM